MAILKIRDKNGEMIGVPAIQGDSGVYVGSGEMPDGYNVQIDTTSDNTSPILMYAPQLLSENEKSVARNNIGAIGVDEVSNGLAANIPVQINLNNNIDATGYIVYSTQWAMMNQSGFQISDKLALQTNDTKFVFDLSGIPTNSTSLAPSSIYSLVLSGWCNIPYGIKKWDIWIDGIPREQWNNSQPTKDGKRKRFDIGYSISSRPDVRGAVMENSGYLTAGFEIHTYFNNEIESQTSENHDIMFVALTNYGVWVPVGVIYNVECFCNLKYQPLTFDNPVFPADCPWGTQGRFFYNNDGVRGNVVNFKTDENGHILPEYAPNTYWIQLY